MKAPRALEEQIDRKWAAFHVRRYRKTGNPLYLWSAYADYRNLGRPLPAFILRYLDRAAFELLSIANSHHHDGGKKVNRVRLILRAFGFERRVGHKRDVFDDTFPPSAARDARIYMEFRRLRDHGASYQDAREAAGRLYGTGETTAREIIRRLRPRRVRR